MTVARKISALLLFLTLGSLLGILAFALFLVETASDGLFVIATNLEEHLSQELEINTLLIRGDQKEARTAQQRIIPAFEQLVSAMDTGGTAVRSGRARNTVALLNQMNEYARSTSMTVEEREMLTARSLSEELPVPSPDLEASAANLGRVWNLVKQPMLTVAEKPAEDPASVAAYELIFAHTSELSQASHAVLATVFTRVVRQREIMLLILGSIAALSIILFVIGLIVGRRYITRPIQELYAATEDVIQGDFSRRAVARSNDEIAILAQRFNDMLAEMNRSVIRYKELFENANDFVYVSDLDGRFTSVNRAAALITGYTNEELLKMGLDDLAVPEHIPLARQMRQLKITGETETTVYEIEITRKDGRHITLENSTRLMYEGGMPVAFQGMGRDVTERKRLQEQLRVAQKMEAVGRFAGGIAHDFGNVLTIINGYCALILNRIRTNDPMRIEVEGIQRAGRRAAGLIRHLLGFSKGQIFRPRLIKMDVALAEMKDMLERLVGEDVRLIINVPPGGGCIRFDPTQLEQVIVNLVLNARDSMPAGGRLTIEAAMLDIKKSETAGPDDLASGPYVGLTVSDTGHGMTQDVLSQIFEPFFSTKEHGTGLGLSTVFGIVRQSGGRIIASSELHAGTQITMLLPRIDEPLDYVEIAESVRVSRGTETILLVEDEVDVRSLVRQMLRYSGYVVLEAVDQGHAVQMCQNLDQRIDLMLTDVVMPHVSGPQLASAVRRVRPELKVVYMSGYPRDKFEKDGFQTDIIHFIQKPLSSESLVMAVREVLDGSAKG